MLKVTNYCDWPIQMSDNVRGHGGWPTAQSTVFCLWRIYWRIARTEHCQNQLYIMLVSKCYF